MIEKGVNDMRWKYRLNIADISKAGHEKSITPSQFLSRLVDRIKEKSDEDKVQNRMGKKAYEESISVLVGKDNELDELLEWMELDCPDTSLTIDEVDEHLSNLYDWADSARCWIATAPGL